jgi:hypothetical protein
MNRLVLLVVLLLAACSTAERYPLTGEECAPGDPVQRLDVPPCP